MNRVEIKELAKSKIKGNIWNILWPLLVIGVLQSVVQGIFNLNPAASIDINNLDSLTSIHITPQVQFGLGIVAIIFGVITAGYTKYILNFVRTGKFNTNDIIDTIKEKWLNILIAVILVYILVTIGMMLLVIPGIVVSLAFSMAIFLVIDTDVSGSDSLKESWDMMKGHKWDYFVFILSFIGWMLLVPFTLGLLLIWLVPYMKVSVALYYDKLKELSNKKDA